MWQFIKFGFSVAYFYFMSWLLNKVNLGNRLVDRNDFDCAPRYLFDC